jgi:peptide subunit release factor RF-3
MPSGRVRRREALGVNSLRPGFGVHTCRQIARWLGPDTDQDLFRFSETKLLEDRDGRAVVLAKSPWYFERLQEKHPELVLSPTAIHS